MSAKNKLINVNPQEQIIQNKKIYVLDTNVLVYDPKAIFAFEGAQVGIPAVVLEELDQFKGEGTDRGRNAREVIRQLDALREKGSLGEGVELDNGGRLRILFYDENILPKVPFVLRTGDNEILLTALALKQQGYNIRFISKDLNARVKADALGIVARDYIKEYVTEEEFYHGWVRVPVPAVDLKRELPADLDRLAREGVLSVNEFVLVESRHNPFNYRVFRYLGGKRFKPVYPPSISWPLSPRNAQQLMALDLLLDPDVPLVCLFGPAGTGKTFLALLAGLHKVLIDDEYEKMLISRPLVPLGRDIGYLPGTIEEKLHSWMLPIYDNMQCIVHAVNIGQHFEKLEKEHRGKRRKIKKGRFKRREVGDIMSIDDLVKHGKVSLEAITYMRGRSIPYQFILIDEAQNLTPHEVKTLVTRVGEGSKIVLAGDPYQIDSPYLDFSSNGLVITSERFKGQKLFGSVFLEHSERSELSQLATDLL